MNNKHVFTILGVHYTHDCNGYESLAIYATCITSNTIHALIERLFGFLMWLVPQCKWFPYPRQEIHRQRGPLGSSYPGA